MWKFGSRYLQLVILLVKKELLISVFKLKISVNQSFDWSQYNFCMWKYVL